MAHGGARKGAGRKTKAEETELIQKLSAYDDVALSAIITGVENGDYDYVKMFMEYRHGKPRQTVDNNISGNMEIVWEEHKSYSK